MSTERFTCPKCGMEYLAVREWFSDGQGGRFDCVECFAEVHSWTSPNDYLGWTPTTFARLRQ
jgi:hypothetical protein